MSTDLVLINNARVYAPEPLGIRHLLLGGGKILAISEQAIALPKHLNVQVVDAEGARVLPGFIDAHTHLTGGGGEAGFATQVPPVPLSRFTAAGVTSVVGLLGTDDVTRSTANLVARAYGLREEGLSAYVWTGGYHYPLTTLTGQAKQDIIYLDPVIGIGEFAISDHRSSQPTYQEMIRLAADAHVAGMMTGKAGVVHFHLGDGERRLAMIERALSESEIPPRVFHPTHVNRNKPLFEHACELYTQGLYIDITAFPSSYVAPGWNVSDALIQMSERGLAFDRVTVSSDGGGCLPHFDDCGDLLSMEVGSSHTLLQSLVGCLKSGFTLEQVLPIYTTNVASLLRLNNKGHLATGSDADLLMVDDALNITHVMAQGCWHRYANKTLKKGTFESPD